jgi:hypothetical protein
MNTMSETKRYWILDIGCWMRGKGAARAMQTISPRVVPLLFVKSTEYLIYPESSIQYPAP